MTFEEFFAKKKIDLVQLEKAEPTLYSEFKSHFNLMGEKSFDHTKKFWFNKLRRLYHLATPEKAITQLETKIASQAEVLSSPTIEQAIPDVPTEAVSEKPVVKPRFTPRNIPVKKENDVAEGTSASDASTPQPAVKKPGFKPRNIKTPASEGTADANNPESRPGQLDSSDTPITNPGAVEEAAKQGYKPKFKMRNVPRDPGGVAEQTGHTTEEKIIAEASNEKPAADTPPPTDLPVSKPAYKPKFNMKNVQKPSEDKVDEEKKQEELPQSAPEESGTSKPAYKPRFNLKNLPKKAEEHKPNEDLPQAPDPAGAPEPNTETPVEPKFNMKNIKPKQDGE